MSAKGLNMTSEELTAMVAARAKHVMEAYEGSIYGLLKVRVEACDADELTYVCAYKTEEWMKNPFEAIHGGMVTTMMDSAMGSFASCVSGVGTPTISIDTNYLRPVPIDSWMYVKVRIMSLGKTVAYVNGEAWMEGRPDRLVATACGTYYTGGKK